MPADRFYLYSSRQVLALKENSAQHSASGHERRKLHNMIHQMLSNCRCCCILIYLLEICIYWSVYSLLDHCVFCITVLTCMYNLQAAVRRTACTAAISSCCCCCCMMAYSANVRRKKVLNQLHCRAVAACLQPVAC